MAIDYRILAEHGLVHVWTNAAVSDQALIAFRTRLVADPGFNPDFDQLVECLVEDPPTLSREVISQAATNPIYSARSRRAIVAARDASYGVARMFSLLQPPGCRVNVYRDLPTALEWLGLAPDVVAPTDPATLVGRR